MLFLRSVALLCFAACTIANAAQPVVAFDSTRPSIVADTSKALPGTQHPQPSVLEKNLFWSTWWSYHAAFIADFTTTGMILDRGGRESDPLYTQFGNKNMVGVIGSAVVIHAIVSIISFELYKTARKRRGAWRFILNATSIGINSYFIGIHTYAAISNVGVYNKIAK